MKLERRRFLAITAAAVCSPGAALATTWTGHGFGAEISITLHGPAEITQPALVDARRTIEHIEYLFSLYDPSSALSQLNRTGVLRAPTPDFLALMAAADAAYRVTGGLFDPTVQTLWNARAQGRAVGQVHSWRDVQFDAESVVLPEGQLLTFNGIAQGFATDKVTEILSAHGLKEALVNIGEFRALGGPWRMGISDPDHGLLATRSLQGRAIATSSAGALHLEGQSHIMHSLHHPMWSTVSVEAATATVADSLSTGLTLAPRDQIAAVKALRDDVHRIVLIDDAGDLTAL